MRDPVNAVMPRRKTILNPLASRRFLSIWAGACIAIWATPARSDDIPWITLEDISLNPTSFYVSIQVTNAWSHFYYALEAYEGVPVGATGGVERVIVSDWVQGTDSSMVLHDTSAPLSQSGRTYNVAATPEVGAFYLLGPNEVYAPYPFFTSPVISAIAVAPTNAGHVLAITYGEGLYTNQFHVSNANAKGFFRVTGTNHIPTNAAIECITDLDTWTSE